MDYAAKKFPHSKEKDDPREEGGEEAKRQLEEEAPIHGDVLEAILARLTLLDLVAASRVSKPWRVAVFTSLRISPRVKPWFIVYTLHYCNRSLTSAYAFDPASHLWLRIDIGNFHRFTTNTSASSELRSSHSNNLLYTLSTRFFSFSFDAFHLTWHHVEAPLVWRQNPVVVRLGSRILVAGGTFVGNPLAVEMFDIKSQRWDMCEPLPVLFKNSATSTWLSAASTERRLYLLEKQSLMICSFDAETKNWGPTINLILRHRASVAVFHSIIGFVDDRLILVGLIGEPEELQGVGLWEIDQVTYECREIGEMPPAMVENLRNANSWLSTPRALMEGDFIYVFNPSNQELILFCELKEGICQWSQAVNPMAKDHNGMQRFMFTCPRVEIGDLEKAMATGDRRFNAESDGDGFSSFFFSSTTPNLGCSLK